MDDEPPQLTTSSQRPAYANLERLLDTCDNTVSKVLTDLAKLDDPLADAVDHTPGLDEAAGGKRKKKLASKAGGGYMTAGLQSGPGLLKSGA